jgi:hypothetical protein
MFWRGVEIRLQEIGPGLWRWQFQIANRITTGTTKTNVRGMAVHRAKHRLLREMKMGSGQNKYDHLIVQLWPVLIRQAVLIVV